MSNSRAIAAVTATLRSLIERGFDPARDPNSDPLLQGTAVTMQPPDEARGANPPERQLNLYLYQVMPNGAYRNADVPRQLRPGETGQPSHSRSCDVRAERSSGAGSQGNRSGVAEYGFG